MNFKAVRGVEQHNKPIWQQPRVIRDLDGDKELEGAERDPGVFSEELCEKGPYSVQ